MKNSMKGKIITRTSTDLITLLVKDKGKEKATKITGKTGGKVSRAN